MTIRELIEQLEEVARTAGDRLEVEMVVTADDGNCEYRAHEEVGFVRYHGGAVVEIVA